jgi:hypothetical protein
MANKSRFIIAESRIKAYFKDSNDKVYNREHLSNILDQNRGLWNLPMSMNVNRFIEKLLISEIITHNDFIFEPHFTKKERYIITNATIFQVAISLVKKSYLSHFSAVYLHGLTNQIPKTIYISSEQSKKNNVDREIEQNAIDVAFSRAQRKSSTTTIYNGYTFLLHNSMYSNRTGVYSLDGLSITNIERTLIDVTVRPGYAGGVDSVLDIYRRAIDRISINKLIATLEKLNFIYPYHQAIGFYLEKAGYNLKKLEPLFQIEMKFDFHLTYEIIEKEYSSRWRLYYPKGM